MGKAPEVGRDVAQAVGLIRFRAGAFVERAVVGEATAEDHTTLADQMEEVAQALRLTAGTLRLREDLS